MTERKTQPKKEIGKWAYVFIPASLSMGIALGWALSRFVTKKVVATQKKIVAERPQCTLRGRFREAISAIDNELSTIKDTEKRKVLVEVAYKLRDLDLRTQLQKSINPSALKQVLRLANMRP